MNLSLLLRHAARQAPEHTALIHGNGQVDFATFDAEADRVAATLMETGVGRGDRVALALPNIPAFAFAYFGILRIGAVAVPLNTTLTEPEVARIIEDSGATVAVAAPPISDALAGISGLTVLTTDAWDQLASPAEPIKDVDAEDNDLAVLPYTSGTTGEPKGVMLTHGNLNANLTQQMTVPGAQILGDDVLLAVLPLFHIFGLNVILGQLVMNRATGVLAERFEPIETLRLIEEQRVTVLFGAPPMYAAWLNTPGAEQYDLSSVRLAVSGAAPLQPDVLVGFRDMFGIEIFEGYGLTETAPTLTSSRMAEAPVPGSVGKPVPGVELRVVDEEGNDVEIGDPGEVIVRGPNVFKGYWNRPEETSAAFVDGWFKTGDVGVFDEEGQLYLVDRKRDLIIVSGFNVYPGEVETALLENPKIADAAVVGMPHPYTGEAVKAFVVLRSGEVATETELVEDARTRLARFKSPDAIEIVDELPHLVTGKVLRRALRD